LNFPQTVKKTSGIPFGNRVFTGSLPRKKMLSLVIFDSLQLTGRIFFFFFQSNIVLQFILKNNIVRKQLTKQHIFATKKIN
jgi:hypothetical protein